MKAVCYLCREDNPIKRLQYGVYMHTEGGQGPCLASAIRKLDDKPEGKQ